MGKSAGIDERVFRQVPVPGKGDRVLPLEVLRFLLGQQQKAMFRLGAHVRFSGTGT